MQRPIGDGGAEEAHKVAFRGVRCDPQALRWGIIHERDRQEHADEKEGEGRNPVGLVADSLECGPPLWV